MTHIAAVVAGLLLVLALTLPASAGDVTPCPNGTPICACAP